MYKKHHWGKELQMRMKRKLALAAVTVALLTVLAGATAPVSAISICDVPTTSFDIWLAQRLARC